MQLAGQTPDLPLISEEAQTQPSVPRGEATAAPDFDVATVLNTVLVVDDSLVVRKVMQRDLEGIGLQVLTAVDGQDALAVLEESPVDIALVDLEMPRMNGLELTSHIRSQPETKDIPVIMITSRATDKHRQLADEAGVSEYLNKPYSEEQLLQCIHSHLQQAGH